MSKFFVACVVLALAAVVMAKSGPKQLNKASNHINSLIKKIKGERNAGIKLHAVHVKHCKTTLTVHRLANTALTQSKKSSKRTISRSKSNIKSDKMLVQKINGEVKKKKKVAEKQAKQIRIADKSRVTERKKFAGRVVKMQSHVAFVRQLTTFIMGSTVERRRTVLVQKAHEVNDRAQKMSGEGASLMEMTAKAMVSGHLNKIYALLDKLRAKIQSGLRQAQRAEENAEREWVRRSSRRRRSETRTWKAINHLEAKRATTNLNMAKNSDDIAQSHIKIEGYEIKLTRHHRDARILSLKCQRWATQHKQNVASWKSELKALFAVKAKIKGHQW